MRHLAVRVPAQLWASIDWFGRAAGHVRAGRLDISETLRELIQRGLVQDRSHEAAWRVGYAEGRAAGYAEFLQRAAAATKGTTR